MEDEIRQQVARLGGLLTDFSKTCTTLWAVFEQVEGVLNAELVEWISDAARTVGDLRDQVNEIGHDILDLL